MKNKLMSRFLITVIIVMAVYPSFQVQAKVQEFSELYLSLNLPEDTVVLTKDTPDTDAKWNEAGITDPKSEKSNFSKMGVRAVLYDPNTKTTVRLLQKYSNQTKDIFNLSLLSKDKLTDFLNELGTSNDKSAKMEITEYPHKEATFFRYSIEMTQNGAPLTEIIYGTIVNGSTITFDTFKNSSIDTVDETFVKELVAGTHFTKFFDKAEIEKQEKASTFRLLLSLVILTVIIVIWIFLVKKKNKKKKLLKDKKTEALTKFYIEQKQKEEQNLKDTILYVNRTEYTEEVFKDYFHFNEIIKRLKTWIIMGVSFFVILMFLYTSGPGVLGCAIALILLFVFIYYQGIRIEKLVGAMKKIYDKNKSKEAVFTFYEDYFTLSGIQYISKYPYMQITEIKEYKNYIYIYIGPEKAFYLKKDGFEQNLSDFTKFIKQQAFQ
ncbi:YcxB family protein [Anaerocolumna sp. MB42-C2]|uniref:YcxB family protein n=1 Tax=Anaerocolumna sp. MB42-C2 TaxID=3070997 RepID=UPI0027DECB6C|nr:YcxB family protein [Anaerocolumna sp. MB42-C2]WMJ86363.1 YcxB family protein [Anaerocolumna sp. MB42-C2]